MPDSTGTRTSRISGRPRSSEIRFRGYQVPTCIALSKDGADCHQRPPQPEHRLCKPHHQEYVKLYERYKKAQRIYDSLDVSEEGCSSEKEVQKLVRGREVIALRDEVNRRFFSESEQNRGHIRKILMLQGEVDALEANISSKGVDRTVSSPEPSQAGCEEPTRQLVYRSLLSPEVSMSALSHLPRDSPVVVLKEAVSTWTIELLEKLYTIVPSLNDSNAMIKDPGFSAEREPDVGDHVCRFVFREFLLWEANSETLAIASKTASIDAFLRLRPSDLEKYIKFFEQFGRLDTLHFLRDAICDYLLPSGTSSTIILGGFLATDCSQRKMTVEGWDILYTYFGDVVSFHNLESFGVRFEDISLIKRLVALKRYGDVADSDHGWLNARDDVSQESLLAPLLGFIAVTKGYSDTPGTKLSVENGIRTEVQCRCYVTGRMAKKHPLAQDMIRELGRLVARFIVTIYDSEGSLFGFGKVVSGCDELPWIRRTRSIRVGGKLDDVEWQVESSLENVLADIATMRRLRENHLIADYYQFIIIDRDAGKKFTIIDEVADTLMRLADDPTPQEILAKAVRDSIPFDQQDQWLQAVSLEVPSNFQLTVPDVRYERSRVRAWDVIETNPDFVSRLLNSKRSRRDTRFTVKIAAEMESHGLITLLKTFEPPHACPIVLPATDGNDDLYFDYNFGPIDRTAISNSPILSPEAVPSQDSLYEFARSFQVRHPKAVFAKGVIHVHYCAWPMPAFEHETLGFPKFRTVEGHLYQWKVLPFDLPLSPRMWQYDVHCKINSRISFARVVQTTFVVCAAKPEEAEENLKTLLTAADEYGWKLSVPPPDLWIPGVEDLDLKTLWAGVYPAAHGKQDSTKGILREAALFPNASQ